MTNARTHLSRLVFCLIFLSAALTPLAAQQLFDPVTAWKKEGWKTDFSKSGISLDEIVSGGPPRDGIPSIDQPTFRSAGEELSLGPQEPVIGLSIDGDARAYPLRILMWHEIVNDVVGGEPVAVTYCPLCNTSIVFRRRHKGETLDFGTSGKLRHSDLVMYDRQSESWWQQFSGEAIIGSKLGEKLTVVPSRLESFERFLERFPDGKVLQPPKGSNRAYGRNPYRNYDSSALPFLFRGKLPKGINPMARVVSVEIGGRRRAVSLNALRVRGVFELEDVRLAWKPGQNSALDRGRIRKGRDVGNVVAQKKVGGEWRDVPYEVTFAFAFHAFHPDSQIIKK